MFLDLPDPRLDLLVRGTDSRIQIRIRICTKMSRIRNTDLTGVGLQRVWAFKGCGTSLAG